jgi:UDP-N-acetylglucosamine 4,6-dehydratase/5-epimerase
LTRILVTGAKGSIGRELVPLIRDRGVVVATDVDTFDVTKPSRMTEMFDIVYHLAGAKQAPVGETDPLETFRVNTQGTANVIASFPGAKIILASTCKACNPETVYGASKLIAERMVLNAGGVVVRYFNVRETAGNVFRYWESLPKSEPIPVADCWRYFITLAQALDLTVAALELPSGRYTVDPGEPSHMLAEARSLYPGRLLVPVPPRRGDRVREPLHAAHEHVVRLSEETLEVINRHDLVSERDVWADWFEGRDAA